MPKGFDKKRNRTVEPEVTPEILSKIPVYLRNRIGEWERAHHSSYYKEQGAISVVISSNSMANGFISEQWDIYTSQAREFKDLYTLVRKHCRNVLKETLALEKLEWETEGVQYSYDVYKFDSVGGNLFVKFMKTPKDYLIFTTENGSQEKCPIYGNEPQIGFEEHEIRSIDLTPLKVLMHLQHLELSENSIQSIDLTPLSSCSRLMELDLDINQLKSIDLTPLSSCYSLEILSLTGNQLQHVDLTPLSSCSNLSELHLDGNQIQRVDLTPLSSCTKLGNLDLSSNQLLSIDLTPLSSCSNLFELYLDSNQLQSIDLTALNSCPDLWAIGLTENKFKSIDLTALKPKIKRCVDVDSTVQLAGET